MISSIVEILLSKYLHKFFYGIQKKNIDVALFDGKFTLSNIGLQQNLLNSLNLPIQLEYSYVEKMEVSIPWLSDEVSLNIYISNIYALIIPKQNIDIYEVFMKRKQKAIEDAIKMYLMKLQEKQKNKKQPGSIQRLLIKLLDNININIGCIHFRYESKDKKYSFGLKINQINAYNVDKQGKKQFFNRQKSTDNAVRYQLSVDFIGLYFNSNQTKFIYQNKHQNKKQQKKVDYAYITNEMRYLSLPEKFGSVRSNELHYVFILSVKTLLKKHFFLKDNLISVQKQTPYFQCQIEFKNIQTKVTVEQYYDIKQLVQFLTSYQGFWRQYVNFMNLNPYKQKSAVEISQILKKKKKKESLNKKQKLSIKKNISKYLQWIFKSVYQESLKKSFIFQALKKQITLQNLLKNKKILMIMRKVEEQKLKSWVIISLMYRKKFDQSTSFLQKNNSSKVKQFLNKTLGPFQPFRKYQDLLPQNEEKKINVIQRNILFKLDVIIHKMSFQISKLDKFGVAFFLSNIRSQILLRDKNFGIQIKLEDLEASVFSSKSAQVKRTFVPIIKRNIILQSNIDLLYLKYQKSPIGRPFIYAEYELDFQSIQITIFPQAFKQFYEILFVSNKKNIVKIQSSPKKKIVHKQQQTNNEFKSVSLQKNMVKGKIRSPWIIFPLGRNNNPQKQCWVVRLGDFILQTPQIQMVNYKNQKQLYYDKYKLQLRQFQLKYFSSVNFFYNWLKLNEQYQKMLKIDFYKNQKMISMINPFSCYIDFQMIKSNLAPVIVNNNYAYISNIYIQGIQIFLSNFLLDKLKQRIDVIGEEENYEDFQFVETNVTNIYQENSISGWGEVTYQRFCQTKLFFVLKGNFLYFFAGENQTKYYFFVDIQQVYIRLMSNRVQKFNEEKQKRLVLYLNNIESHQEWRKHINSCLQKKQRKLQNPYKEQKQNTGSPIFKKNQLKLDKKKQKLKPLNDLNRRRSKRSEREEEQIIEINQNQIQSKVCFSFIMNKLQIRLRDKTNKQFLYCQLKKSNLTYRFLFNKQTSFTLSSWDIYQNNVITQVSSQFLSSKKFFNQEQTVNVNDNFLEVQLTYNQITNQLNSIQVEIDKLFIAWKVDLITKILVFFFYPQDVGDTPAPSNVQKRKLSINFNIKKFYLYCYQNQYLAGLIKTNNISILYYQSKIQEYFQVRCKKFQIDRIIQNSLHNKQPLMLSKGQQNPMYLKYHIRKQKYYEYKNVQILKKQFGEDLIVSELTCAWKNSIIYYEHEITFRILNYFLNNVLGTVGAKFKKRQYSTKYILQLLKMIKIGTMKINFENFTFIVPPHQKKNQLILDLQQFIITKNIRSQPEYRPIKVKIPTIKQDITTFYETMVFQFLGLTINYQYGQQKPMILTSQKQNLRFLMSKVNFAKQYFPILKHYDDFDRKMIIKVDFLNQLELEFHKIIFLTILQIFYQNIRHKDGKADSFDPPLSYPSYRQYLIKFPKLSLNMYQFLQKNQKMEIFNFVQAFNFEIQYNQIGQKSIMRFKSSQLHSIGQLKLDKQGSTQIFDMQMTSAQNKTKLVIKIEGYKINFSFDQLNNILEYINYDSDYVSNHIMAKKPNSFMGIHVFAKQCEIILQQLHVQGDFYVTYLKNSQNTIQRQLLDFVRQSQSLESLKKQSIITQIKSNSSEIEKNTNINWEDIIDKEIKVDGQNIKLSIKGDQIGKIQSLYFHRTDISSKLNNKRFKKQIVQIGQSMLYVQLSDFKKIYNAYDKKIKKNVELLEKQYFQPWNLVPQKAKLIQKRRTQVQFSRISFFLLSSQKQKLIFYLNAEIQIPKLIYSTYKDYQQIKIQVSAQVYQVNFKIRPIIVGQLRKIKFIYTNQKQKFKKLIQIQNGKNMKILLSNLQNQSLHKLVNQFKSKQQKSRKYINYNYGKHVYLKSNFIVRNTTSYLIKVSLANFSFQIQSFSSLVHDINYEQLLQIFRQNWLLKLKIGSQMEYSKKLYQITLNQQTGIVNQLLLRCSYDHNSFSLQLFESGIIKNNTKVNFLLQINGQKPVQIKANQQKCIWFSSKQKQVQHKLSFIKKSQTIGLRLIHDDQSFCYRQQVNIKVGQVTVFKGLVNIFIFKQKGFYRIILKEKFNIQNFTPFTLTLGKYDGVQRQIKYGQNDVFSFGLVNQLERTSISQIRRTYLNSTQGYLLFINNDQFQINLNNPKQFQQLQVSNQIFPYQAHSQQSLNKKKYYKQKIKIHIKKQKNLKFQTFVFFTSFIISNTIDQTLLYSSTTTMPPKRQFNQSDSLFQLSNDQMNSLPQKWQTISINKKIVSKYRNSQMLQNNQGLLSKRSSVFQKQKFKLNKANKADTNLYLIDQDFWITLKIQKIGENKEIDQYLLNITSRISCLNYSTYIVKVILAQEESIQLFSNDQKQLPFQILQKEKQVQIQLIDFKLKTKYVRKVPIDANDIYYLKVGEQILKVTVLKSDINQASWLRILMQNSNQGHQIDNKINDIVLLVKNQYEQTIQNDNFNKKHPKKRFIQQQQQDFEQQKRKKQFLLQPLQSRKIGLRTLSKNQKKIKIQFYYPLKNIDFKQNLIVDFDNLPDTIKQIKLQDSKTKTCIDLIIVYQKEKQGNTNIRLFKKNLYRSKPPQLLILKAHQISLSLQLSAHQSITLEICQLNVAREKGLQLQNIDIKLKQILIKQGQSDSILCMLDNKAQFLNFQAILQKNTLGLSAKSLIIKFCPFQINGRQRIFMKLLSKISKIRYFKSKNELKSKQQKKKKQLRISLQRQKINLQIPISEGVIKQQLQMLKKGTKALSIQSLQIFKSTILMSYIKSKQPLTSESQFSDPIIKYFLLLPSISQTKIPIPHFQIKSFKGSSKQLLKQIAKQLKSSIGQTVLYSLTSLAIFDNPISAIDDIIRYITTILTIM